MSMRKQGLGPIPENTKQIATKVFRKGNLYMKIADELGEIYDFDDFADLFPTKGQSAQHPIRLTLITILQFREGLSDREAVEAVRSRIDWKYLLHLDVEDEGFDHSVLSEFRERLHKHEAAEKLLDKLLDALREKGLVKVRGKQRTDSTHILAAVKQLNRLELVHETMRYALECLATVDQVWVSESIPGDWYSRYGQRMFSFNAPNTDKEREKLASIICSDGWHLLKSVESATKRWLAEIPAIATLRKVWEQQFSKPPDPPRFLELEQQPPSAERIASPHDTDSRFSIKKGTQWNGYKLHITETCDDELPRLIVNVETTVATEPDCALISTVHRSLDRKGLLPSDHMVDTGYISVDNLLSSKNQFGVRLVGPATADQSWQAREGGFDKSYFELDWLRKQAICPNGKTSRSWTTHKDGTSEVSFKPADCYRCKFREVCVRGTTEAGHPKARHLSLRTQEEHEALQLARGCLENEETKELYKKRAGIEGTISQTVRRSNSRTARYVGLAKIAQEHIFTALAVNFTKLGEWFSGTPLAKTRKSHLERLKTA